MFGFRFGRRTTLAVRRRQTIHLDCTEATGVLEPRLLLSANVLTYHNDNLRTGATLDETTLNLGNVNVATFGKVGQVAVDGAVYAQPLYKSNVPIPGQGVHNLVFIATENDSVYAFDADTLALVWHDSFINPAAGVTPVPYQDTGASDIIPEIGITGTPVIDATTSTLYVVSKTRLASGKKVGYQQSLNALDLATGQQKFGGPVLIQASVRGKGAGSVNGKVSFNPLRQLQRAGLLLVNGTVYVAFASLGDIGPYHGWILGYNATTLHQVAVFNDTPNGKQGGIWMAGEAPAADASGDIFVGIGNGTFDAGAHPKDLGDSLVKLSSSRGLTVLDYFAPSDQAKLNKHDLDFASGGVLLLPDQPGPVAHALVTAGKEGRLYVLNRDNLGHYSSKVDRVIQEIPNAFKALWATPAYFNGRIYVAGAGERGTPDANEPLEAFSVIGGKLPLPPATGNFLYGYPGSSPSISASGTTDAIVWTLDNSAYSNFGPAILRAYDANNIVHELYDSTQAGSRDLAGGAVKFTVPTVANGRVYVGGFNSVTMYGLLA
jgi:hypothetical protein